MDQALTPRDVLRQIAQAIANPRPDSVETSLQLAQAPRANTSRYDSLRAEVDVLTNTVEASHAS